MADKPYQNEEWLYEKYHEEGLTGNEMAELAGCARTTIYEWMRRHEIPRDRGEGYRVSDPEPYRSEEWLREKYHDERLSTGDIAELCDTTKQTIREWMDKLGVEKRTRSEAAKVRLENKPELREVLIKSGTKALKEHGSNPKDAMSEAEFEAFCNRLSENRTGKGNPMWNVTGEDHHHYKENPTPSRFYQSAKWRETRQEVLERDNERCQACGGSENLHVHHIIPVSAGGSRYDPNNLVTLCDTHHREWEGLYLRPDTR